MTRVSWTGPAAPASLAAALRSRDIRVVRGDAADAAVRVVCTASGRRVPNAPADRRWVWVCRGTVAEARCIQAVLRGAYQM